MSVEASSSKCAHPPRSNRPRSSSSGPPGPCITPSTETCAVVVSFMVAVPFSLDFVVVRLDRTAAPISPVAAESVRPIHSAPSPNTAGVDDVVLLNVHPVHSQALFPCPAALRFGSQICFGEPSEEAAGRVRAFPLRGSPMTVYVEGPIYQLSSRDDPCPAERTRPAELGRTGGPGPAQPTRPHCRAATQTA